LIRLGIKGRQWRIILELASFDQDLLPFRFDTGEGVQLELEGFAIRRGIELDFVAFTLVLDNDYIGSGLG